MFKNFPRLNILIIFFFSLVFFVSLLVFQTTYLRGEQQFSYLAHSFLRGDLYLPEGSSVADAVSWGGHLYWPLGPFPAILLIPFVFIFSLFHLVFYQGYLSLFFTLLIFLLIYKIARKINYNFSDAWYLAYAFCFSSIFLGVSAIGFSWYFAQTVTVFLLFLALLEFFGKKRYYILGFIFAAVFLTRITAALGVIFIILDLLFLSAPSKEKIKNFFKLLLPLLISLFLLLAYNQARFGNFLDQGYVNQILGPDLSKARSYGLVNIIHLPGNLYYCFLNTPDPVFRDNISHVLKFPFIKADSWGMSIFLLSPYLLYLFFKKIRGRLSINLLISAATIAFVVFLYYGIGSRQFGYRYALDFLPLVFLIFMITYQRERKTLSNGLKILIILSSLFNLFLFFTIF